MSDFLDTKQAGVSAETSSVCKDPLLEKTGPDDEVRSRLKEGRNQNNLLDAVFNPTVRLQILDVMQTTMIKNKASEKWRPGVDQQDREPAPKLLHRHQAEDRYLPGSSSAGQMKAATGGDNYGGAETTRNPDLNSHEDDSSLSETEGSEDDEDVFDSDSQLKSLFNSGSEPKDSDKDWKESKAPESGENTVNKSCSCSECGERFLHKRSLQRHMTQHSKMSSKDLAMKKCFKVKETVGSRKKIQSKQKSFCCNDCGKKFKKKSILNIHMRIHTGQKPFACDLCGQRFGLKSHLNSHMIIHTGQKPFACDLCGQRFGRMSHLNSHMIIHTGHKPFACDVCGQRFGLKLSLNRHEKIHTGQKPFSCDVCGQRFRQKTHLNAHVIIHTGQKKFACDLCGQRFGHKSNLNLHMRVHTGQKPFTCDLCGQRFRQKAHLNAHLIVHTGQKPFACGDCGQRFGLKSNLKSHMIIHTGQKPFVCHLCGHRFGRKSHLNSHMIIHTGQK